MVSVSRSEILELLRIQPERQLSSGQSDVFASNVWWRTFIENIARDEWRFALLGQSAGDDSVLLPIFREDPEIPRWAGLSNYYTGQLHVPESVSLKLELPPISSEMSEVEFSPLSAKDALRLCGFLKDEGWIVRVRFAFGNWYLPRAGLSFDQYMTMRPAALKNTWLRKRRPFDKGTTHQLQIVRNDENLGDALDAFESVYKRSWKPAEGSAQFVREWARRCAERGWLRLGLAWINDVPVAAHFWFTVGGRAFIFKLAYDEEFSRMSVGTILAAHMFRESLDVDKVREVDFLSGDDAYKRDWMPYRRQRYCVTACSLNSVYGLRRSVQFVVGEMRDRLNKTSASKSLVGESLRTEHDGAFGAQ